MEITGISKSIDVERLTSERSTLLGIGTRQYVKVVFYVDLNQNRRKVKVKGVYVDVINIYGVRRVHQRELIRAGGGPVLESGLHCRRDQDTD